MENLSDQKYKVCSKIDSMKATWIKIANSGNFDETLENQLAEENKDFHDLEKDVNSILSPFEKAQEFLSWTFNQMNDIIGDEDIQDYPESEFDDIVLEEYLTSGAIIIINLNKWIGQHQMVDSDLEKRRILAFKDYCRRKNVIDKQFIYRRFFLVDKQANSIANDGFVTFREKTTSDDNNCDSDCLDLKRGWFNIKNDLKPIAPLFEGLNSFRFIMDHINDADIRSTLQSYYQSFENIGVIDQRLKAIGKV